MHRHRSLFRSTALATVAALGLAAAPGPVLAQPAPPPDAPMTTADPPARVARLAALRGIVSAHGAQDATWSAAFANEPVATGTSLWTQPEAEATVELDSGRLAMAGGTGLDLTGLDDAGLRTTLSQGEVYLHVARMAPNETWQVQTPRGQVTLQAPGRYVVVAGTTDSPTQITVLEGSAAVTATGVDLGVRAQETATIDGTDPFQASVGPAQRDAFTTAMLERERPPPAPAVPPPPAVAAMPGGADLSGYGAWAPSPEYGTVWYPQVAPDWVPYRDGRWAYVAPWGWTWVDDAPWGFAPFHYGRWVQIDRRWAWVPVAVASPPVARPVYAPALVGFFAVGTGVAVGVGLGAALGAGSIGWCPLGPHEAYRPWFPASPRYVNAVNVTHVTNITNVTNVTNVTLINRGAATVVPANAMLDSRPLRGLARPGTSQTMATARPIVGQPPLHPTLATVGVTPSVARQMNLTPVPGAPVPRAAPGPMIRPIAAGPAARPPLPNPHEAPLHAGPAAQPVGGGPMGAPDPHRGVAVERPSLPPAHALGVAPPLPAGHGPAAAPPAPVAGIPTQPHHVGAGAMPAVHSVMPSPVRAAQPALAPSHEPAPAPPHGPATPPPSGAPAHSPPMRAAPAAQPAAQVHAPPAVSVPRAAPTPQMHAPSMDAPPHPAAPPHPQSSPMHAGAAQPHAQPPHEAPHEPPPHPEKRPN